MQVINEAKTLSFTVFLFNFNKFNHLPCLPIGNLSMHYLYFKISTDHALMFRTELESGTFISSGLV